MTQDHAKTGRILPFLTVLSSMFLATTATAEPGADAIMLERIGAVRMAQPDEIKQRPAQGVMRVEQHQTSH